jgi:formylglycine-generating enzyme required for sulfatase activity/predicted Ser/Thr protein kinase
MDDKQIADEFVMWLDENKGSNIEGFAQSRRLPPEWMRGWKLRRLLLRELAWRHSNTLPINTDEYSRQFPDADQHEFLKMALSEHQSRVQDDSPGPGSVGGLLCDRYLLLRRLGAGGFGEVWLADDRESKQQVAIKVPHAEKTRIEKLRKEAEKLSLLNVVGVPRLHRSFELTLNGQQTIGMVFEYISGTTLAEEWQRRKASWQQIDTDWISSVMADAAGILRQVHSSAIWHCDLKPQNILIDQNQKVWIVDFGLSVEEIERAELSANTLSGTVEYMSPERVKGLKILDGRSDVWSLGVILFELMTGKPPFSGPREKVIEAIKTVQLSPAITRRDDVPESLDRICRKCLQLDIVQRYQSAGELERELRHWKTGGEPALLVAPFDAHSAQHCQQAWTDYLSTRSEIPTRLMEIDLKLIPRGQFSMGSPEDQGEADERPRHQVQIQRPFLMGKTCITQKQWRTVMMTEPWLQKRCVQLGDDHPAVFVSWHDAEKFCEKLSTKTGRKWRLPTEAEWEYSCRAGTVTLYNFGDDWKLLGEYAWWGGVGRLIEPKGNCKSEFYAHETRLLEPNAFGLHDMHGNLWEWCKDDYVSDYYGHNATETAVDPCCRSDASSEKVCRGGSWQNLPRSLRSAARHRNSPDTATALVGFRVVVELT